MKLLSKTFSMMLLAGLPLLAFLAPAIAEHRAKIESATQQGNHFDALITYDKVSKRKLSGDSHLATAKSAWALSLPDRAIQEFDLAINSGQLNDEQAQQAKFSKAIIHFQEGRADEALMLSQKLLEDLNGTSAFKARVLTLAAQSLIRMGSKAQAEEKLSAAFSQASYLERSDIAYQLGELQNQLGRWEEAKQYLKTISIDEDRAADSIRLLIQICLTRKEYKEAQSWLDKAKENFAEQFNDSWVYYVDGLLAAESGDLLRLENVLTQAQQKLAPSDTWLTLLEAEKEAFLAKNLKAKLKDLPKEGQL